MSSSPVFVAQFADGVVTRMTTWCASDNKLDVGRGLRLARHAYRARTKCEPCEVVEAYFETPDGTRLASYDAGALREACND
jgi:hypothetical protein